MRATGGRGGVECLWVVGMWNVESLGARFHKDVLPNIHIDDETISGNNGVGQSPVAFSTTAFKATHKIQRDRRKTPTLRSAQTSRKGDARFPLEKEVSILCSKERGR